MNSIGDYNEIMSNHNLFNKVVYTPLSEALKILDKRQKDLKLIKKITDNIKDGIPFIFKEKKCGIMARQIATPNYESRAFISITNENNLHPVFVEYFEDKFTSNNKYKHSLGQLHIKNKVSKNGEDCISKVTIIDFNKYNGEKISSIKTLWGESLVDFHKKLFELNGLKDFSFFNELEWYKKDKEKPIDFYLNLFLLVSGFGILFENFSHSNDSEGNFTKTVVLPTIEKIYKITGVKPLIVPIPPMDLETDDLWYCHLPIIKKIIPTANE